jgi:LysM repeat protein
MVYNHNSELEGAKHMSDKDSAQSVIESYRKRQSMAQKAPIIFGIAALLLIVGAGVLIFWLANPGGAPVISLFASATPTSTDTSTPTSTPTNTPLPTDTATLPPPTDTPTPTLTATATGPFVYIVQEGDTLYGIADKFKVDLLTIYALNPSIDAENPVIRPNQEILIPAPDTKLPTASPIPPDFRGTIEYQVGPNDTLESIATRFNSTVDAIMKANPDLENANDIKVGDKIKIPVNIATPAPTRTPGVSSTLTAAAPTATTAP